LIVPESAPMRPAVFSPAETSIASLKSAMDRILSTLPKPAELARAAVAPVVALEDVIKQVHARLTSAIRARFSDLTRSSDRHEVIVHFLAVLELVRAGSASVSQEKLFSDIEIELEHIGAPRYG
ncbi:MAG TPA: segregation/condensation protein A, partial [Candidatus Paceibacterota bacterium]|nr:segregation/condensation protein A [Candidatus Paceibacterota bacterium]